MSGNLFKRQAKGIYRQTVKASFVGMYSRRNDMRGGGQRCGCLYGKNTGQNKVQRIRAGGDNMREKGALTDKQERFCQEYIIDYNGTRAAIRAGYSEDSARFHASRMLSRDNIRARVRELQAEQVKRLAVSQDYVVQQLVSVYQKCSEPEPVEEWDGEAHEYLETGKYTFDSKGANKALELLGKHLGMYQDKVSVDVQTPKFEGEQDIE